jgi:phosphinothricin acetyltransferase
LLFNPDESWKPVASPPRNSLTSAHFEGKTRGVKPLIRAATEQDAAALQQIYAPFCERSAVSFEITAPTPDEMRKRIQKITAQYPWLVCEADGAVLGYAYACAHRERAAYRWAVDVAVYVGEGRRRSGVGRALYASLFRILVQQGYYRAYAGITLPNPGSVGLHEAMGFAPVGVYRMVGYKAGAWRDVGWWALSLQPERGEPAEPRSVREIQPAPEWAEALRAGLAHLQL